MAEDRELGVRYVLEGSVRRMGGPVRVNAQLIDAGTGAHLWVEQMAFRKKFQRIADGARKAGLPER